MWRVMLRIGLVYQQDSPWTDVKMQNDEFGCRAHGILETDARDIGSYGVILRPMSYSAHMVNVRVGCLRRGDPGDNECNEEDNAD